MGLRPALGKVVHHGDLSAREAAAALEEIVSGEASPVLVGAFLAALHTKGETHEEVAAFASAMREHAIPVTPDATGLVDTCGTGGDGTGTVNLSTAAALVVAGAGLPVAKHGNRALSSRSGSADVLEELGVRLDLTAEQVARCIDEAGIGFMFAPAFHPAMAQVMPVRRELGIRTVFNVLGPLTNPASPAYQLVGAGNPTIAEMVAGAMSLMPIERAMVVHGAGGADELTLAGENLVIDVRPGHASTRSVTPADAGLAEAPLSALAGGTPQDNAKRLVAVLEGERGPVRDCVVFNAGAALTVAGAAEDLRSGAALAAEVLDSGRAGQALDRLVSLVREL